MNKMVFHDQFFSPTLMDHKKRLVMEENKIPSNVLGTRNLLDPCIYKEKHWEFFYGACQGDPGMCGIGAVLFIHTSQYFLIIYASRLRTNNWVEFLVVWILMKTTIEKGIKHVFFMIKVCDLLG